MTTSPLEEQALRALSVGDDQHAVEALVGHYTLEDLGTLLRAVESANGAFEASITPGTEPEDVPVEDVIKVVGMALDDDLASWPATSGHTEAQRAGILKMTNAFAGVVGRACIRSAV